MSNFMLVLFLECIECGEDVECEALRKLYSHDYGRVKCDKCGALQEWEIRIKSIK